MQEAEAGYIAHARHQTEDRLGKDAGQFPRLPLRPRRPLSFVCAFPSCRCSLAPIVDHHCQGNNFRGAFGRLIQICAPRWLTRSPEAPRGVQRA